MHIHPYSSETSTNHDDVIVTYECNHNESLEINTGPLFAMWTDVLQQQQSLEAARLDAMMFI